MIDRKSTVRRSMLGVLAGSAALSLAPRVGFGQPKAPTGSLLKVRYASQPNTAEMGRVLGKVLGYDREFGVDWEFINLRNPSEVAEALITSRVDFGAAGSFGSIPMGAVGAPVKVTVAYAYGGDRTAVIVRKDAAISSPKDLVGKKIAVRSGGLDSAMLLIAFKKSGVSPTDVQIINMNLDDVLAALVSGQVDAGATTEPGASLWLNKGVGKIAFRGGKYLAAYAMGHMTDSFIKNDAAAFGSMQAYCKAVWWGRNNLAEAAKILAKEFNAEVKPIADSLQWIIFDPRLKPLAKESELELAVLMKDENRIRKVPDFDKYHDAALIKRCEKEHPEWFADLDDYAKRKAQM